jgi:MFS family permease
MTTRADSSGPEASRLRDPPSSIWTLGLVSLFMDMSSEMIHSLLPIFLVNVLGASVLTVGVIEGLAESTALIIKVFSGMLSDYLGKRKALAVAGYALSALTNPLFPLASSVPLALAARLIDRLGKGVRGAPRDALIADIVPAHARGAAFGLRQSLDTVGAFLGPLCATALLLWWTHDLRHVFWWAVLPAAASVTLLMVGVREPEHAAAARAVNPIQRENLHRLSPAYWSVVALAAVFTLARFSEAFLVLRARQAQVPTAFIPLVMVAMNAVYAASAYPFGRWSDRVGRWRLLVLGLLVLVAADLVLAAHGHWAGVLVGVALWGVHMGMTQGLLSALVADTCPGDLRGTGFGLFNLVSGLVMLVASALAGWLWDRGGASATFLSGAGFALLTLMGVGLVARRRGSAGAALS